MEEIHVRNENYQHHHRYADATNQYTRSNLRQIKRRDKLNKMLFYLCVFVGLLLGIAVVVLYTVN
jgi:hypothetical protein